MSTRSQRRMDVETIEDDEVVPDGWAARVADRLLENPAMSGRLFVMALTATAIISNAMVLQSVRHPEPLFMTRPAPAMFTSDSDADAVPLPRPRADQVGAIAAAPSADPPLPRLPPVARPADTPASRAGQALVAELQRALAAKGLYAGAIDGISGSRTRAAITAYQQAAGLPVTGEPNASVLDHITTASLAPPAKAAPSAKVTPRREKLVVPASSKPSTDDDVQAIPAVMERIPLPAAEPAQPAASSAPQAAAAQQEIEAKIDAEIAAHDRYLTIQRALNRAGYGPVPENGEESAETSEAIRRFELDNGLPITGAAEDHVIARLIAIGAMAATGAG